MDYVLSRFSRYDVVFLGEWHRIKHDVQLVQALIPRLYAAGIRTLGFEFACEEDQAVADRVVTAETYDEEAVRLLLFHQFTGWGYREYEDVYRVAWQVNRSRKPGTPPFRVVGLGYRARWDLLQPGEPESARDKVWVKGDPDEHMASVVLHELRSGTSKMLVYSGIHHAFTRYRQPRYDPQTQRLIRLLDNRMGNVVARALAGRTFTIFLHSPWTDPQGALTRPAAGVIDRALEGSGLGSIGFDLIASPLGAVPVPDSYYAIGHDNFKVADFADGWIWQRPFREYEGCTVDEQFITPENLAEAIAYTPNAAVRSSFRSPSDFFVSTAKDANMQQRLKTLF